MPGLLFVPFEVFIISVKGWRPCRILFIYWKFLGLAFLFSGKLERMEKKQSDGDVTMLKYQNQKLSQQVEMHRKEISNLEQEVHTQKQKQVAYEDTLLCINRLWEQLNNDIVFMSRRAKGWPAEPAKAAAEGGGLGDPFLDKLLKGSANLIAAVAAKQDDLKEYASEIEIALGGKATSTKEALAVLLGIIQSEQERNDRLAGQLANGAPDAAAMAAELARLQSECQALRNETDSQKALNRSLEEEMDHLEARHLRDEDNIKSLTNELADKAEEVTPISQVLCVGHTRELLGCLLHSLGFPCFFVDVLKFSRRVVTA